jgi:hypothetical protein
MYADHILFIESSWAVDGVIMSFDVLKSTDVPSLKVETPWERGNGSPSGLFESSISFCMHYEVDKRELVDPCRRLLFVPL